MTSPLSSLLASPDPKGLLESPKMPHWLLQARREARSDLSTRWAHGLCAVCISGLISALIILSEFYGVGHALSACHPDGTFSVHNEYNSWEIAGFFQINTAFGRLTFTQAKVIDTIWDVVREYKTLPNL